MSYDSYLSHHGIKGQKWGVENGPPYPLNDVVKAIAYRAGEMSNGKKVKNFTVKDVNKARKIINKNLKAMTAEELREYKSRILMEKDMSEILGTDTGSKLLQKLKNNAVDSVSDSLKTTGTKMLVNAETAVVGEIVSNAFGADVGAMVTDGLSRYQLSEKKYQRSKDKWQKEKEERDYEERKYQHEKDKVLKKQSDYKNETDRIKALTDLAKNYNDVDNAEDVNEFLEKLREKDKL